MLGNVMLDNVMLGDVMLGNIKFCSIKLCNVMLCNIMTPFEVSHTSTNQGIISCTQQQPLALVSIVV